MAWILLIIAGLLECVWAIGLKQSDGFTRLWPSILTVVTMIASFVCLSLALKHLPVGTGYAIWTGIGAVGTAILGMVFLKEPRDIGRIMGIVLIVAGIVLLKVSTRSSD